MYEIIFDLIFPLVLLGILIIIFISGISKRKTEMFQKTDYMSLDDYIKDWLNDHGQKDKVDQQFAKMKKDPSGKMYMPITYKGAKFFIKCGLSPNKVSYLNLILSFFIFYGVVMAGRGHALDWLYVQPFYGTWFLPLGILVLYTGIQDGIDGTVARLLEIKSKSGAWLDHVIDRVTDILLLVGFIPTQLLTIPEWGNLNFNWMVWTNIFLIILYEYMRAKHEGLGLLETKPFVGEKTWRILVIAHLFGVYGASSLGVLVTLLIGGDPTIWAITQGGTITWTMLILQMLLMLMMILSIIFFSRYVWKKLKEMDGR